MTWLDEQLGKRNNMGNGYGQNRQQPGLEVIYEIVEVLNVDVRELIV